MFLKIVGARSAEQSGIKGVKKPFDPNIIIINIFLSQMLCSDCRFERLSGEKSE